MTERITEVLRRVDLGERPAAIARALDLEPKDVSRILASHRPNLKSTKAGKPNVTRSRDRVYRGRTGSSNGKMFLREE